MSQLLADLRYALRTLRRVPLFTTVAVLSMAFGIAANTAVFTLLDQVILRTLPGRRVRPNWCRSTRAAWRTSAAAWATAPSCRTRCIATCAIENTVFTGMFCRAQTSLHVGHDGRTEQVAGRARLRHVLPAARRPPRDRAPLHRRRRPDARRTPGGGARVCALALALQRRPGDRRPHDHRQRTAAGSRRCRAAGFRRTRHRPAGAALRPGVDAAEDGARHGCSSRDDGSAGSRSSRVCAPG